MPSFLFHLSGCWLAGPTSTRTAWLPGITARRLHKVAASADDWRRDRGFDPFGRDSGVLPRFSQYPRVLNLAWRRWLLLRFIYRSVWAFRDSTSLNAGRLARISDGPVPYRSAAARKANGQNFVPFLFEYLQKNYSFFFCCWAFGLLATRGRTAKFRGACLDELRSCRI